MNQYNVAIIGLGHVATHQVAAFERIDAFNLMAVCDSDADRLGAFGLGKEAYSGIEEVLSIPDLDVVVVATPNRLHVEHGLQVLEAGKWLVMEKPVAETASQFSRLVEARDLRRGRCTVALHAAFGTELEWFCKQESPGGLDPRELESFHSQFYDPYFQGGRIQTRAFSLGGSWTDSGVNALSVICRLIPPDQLSVHDSRISRVEGSGCREFQGTVDFHFKLGKRRGFGSIDTNWTLGRDKKATTLGFRGSDQKIVLDHSAQAVFLQSGNGNETLFACENDLPRLTNHYLGVFEDLARQIAEGRDNFEYAQTLHRFLFQAEEWEGVG